MKRYLLFGYFKYYPAGGMNDCDFTSDSLELCVDYLKLRNYDYYHVYDTLNREYIDLHVAGQTFDKPQGLIEFK